VFYNLVSIIIVLASFLFLFFMNSIWYLNNFLILETEDEFMTDPNEYFRMKLKRNGVPLHVKPEGLMFLTLELLSIIYTS